MQAQQTPTLHLYDRSNYQQIEWPPNSQYARDYLLPLLSSGSLDYLTNVDTHMFALKVAGQTLPLTVNHTEYDNSYLCSQLTKYVTYAKQEFMLNVPSLRILLNLPLKALEIILKTANINQIACVNNWLVSTNLYPNLEDFSVKNTTEFLIDRFPKHAIMFPSLNRHTNGPLMDQLEKQGYILVPSREVFIFDQTLKDYSNIRRMQMDLALLKKTPYQIVCHDEITEQDYDQITELYNLLYIKKYSKCNPMFSPACIKWWHEKKLINFQGIRDRNKHLVGVIGSFNRNGVLATPLVGYDTQLPPQEGIYRMLTALSVNEALTKKFVFNMSSGASEFKKWRGGVGHIEYSAVYHKHLPLHMRSGWNLLRSLMTHFGVKVLRKYKF